MDFYYTRDVLRLRRYVLGVHVARVAENQTVQPQAKAVARRRGGHSEDQTQHWQVRGGALRSHKVTTGNFHGIGIFLYHPEIFIHRYHNLQKHLLPDWRIQSSQHILTQSEYSSM